MRPVNAASRIFQKLCTK